MSSELVSGLLGAIVGGAISYYSSSWLYKKQIMQEVASYSNCHQLGLLEAETAKALIGFYNCIDTLKDRVTEVNDELSRPNNSNASDRGKLVLEMLDTMITGGQNLLSKLKQP